MTESLPANLVPPFTLETAILKVRKAEDGWNSRSPRQVALAYCGLLVSLVAIK